MLLRSRTFDDDPQETYGDAKTSFHFYGTCTTSVKEWMVADYSCGYSLYHKRILSCATANLVAVWKAETTRLELIEMDWNAMKWLTVQICNNVYQISIFCSCPSYGKSFPQLLLVTLWIDKTETQQRTNSPSWLILWIFGVFYSLFHGVYGSVERATLSVNIYR